MRNIKATKEMYSTQNNLIVLLLQLGFPKSYQKKKEREWYKWLRKISSNIKNLINKPIHFVSSTVVNPSG